MWILTEKGRTLKASVEDLLFLNPRAGDPWRILTYIDEEGEFPPNKEDSSISSHIAVLVQLDYIREA